MSEGSREKQPEPFGSFFLGFGFFWLGIKYLFARPNLWPWALIPFMIDILLLVLMLWWGVGWLDHLVTGLVMRFVDGGSQFWFSLLYYPVFLIFALALFLAAVYLTYVLATVIAAPFNSLLAERVLVEEGILPTEYFSFSVWLKRNSKLFWLSLVRAGVLLCLGLIIFIMSFIPGLNVLAFFLAMLIMASDSMDYSLEVLDFSLSRRWNYLKTQLPLFSGMAAAFGLTLLIPGLTLLLLAPAVVGASLAYCRQQDQKP